MTELLIVGGDSNSDPSYTPYAKNGIMIWPEIIATENGWDLINTSICGSSNDSIENSVYDAVLKHSDKNPIVMVFWSSPCRINLWDIDHFVLDSEKKRYTEWNNVKERYRSGVNKEQFAKHFSDLDNFSYEAWLKYREYLDDKHHEDIIDEFYKLEFLVEDIIKKYLKHISHIDIWNEIYNHHDTKIVDASLRCFMRLKDILELKNIRHTFKYSLSLVEGLVLMYPWWKDEIENLPLIEKAKLSNRHLKVLKYCEDHPIVKELGMTWKDVTQGFCHVTNKEYLLDCGHPNQKGHDKLAELFMEIYDE